MQVSCGPLHLCRCRFLVAWITIFCIFLFIVAFPSLFLVSLWLVNISLVSLMWHCIFVSGCWFQSECHACLLPPQEISSCHMLLISFNNYQHLGSFFFLSSLIKQYSALIAHLGDRCVANGNMTFLSTSLKYLTNTYKASTPKHNVEWTNLRAELIFHCYVLASDKSAKKIELYYLCIIIIVSVTFTYWRNGKNRSLKMSV